MFLNCEECGTPVEVSGNCVRVTCSDCVARSMLPAASEGEAGACPPEVRALVSGECANYVGGKHLGDLACDVCDGRRCKYFEAYVLPAHTKHNGYHAYQAAYIRNAVPDAAPKPADSQCKPVIVPTVRKGLTPLKAIRARCLDCWETRKETAECVFDGEQDALCPLWAYRFGKNPKRMGIGKGRKTRSQFTAQANIDPQRVNIPETAPEARKPQVEWVKLAAKANPWGYLAAIRAYCTWCCADQPLEVKFCPSSECPLHEFRMGRRKDFS